MQLTYKNQQLASQGGRIIHRSPVVSTARSPGSLNEMNLASLNGTDYQRRPPACLPKNAPVVRQRFLPDDKNSISSSLDSRAGLSVAHRGSVTPSMCGARPRGLPDCRGSGFMAADGKQPPAHIKFKGG